MQPTVLPWAGYFNLMYLADDFIFFDDVQLEKSSWQTRNRLLLGGQARWLSLPIVNLSLSQKICDTQIISNDKWFDKMYQIFRLNYSKHPFFNDADKIIQQFIQHKDKSLSSINIKTICFVAEHLELRPIIYRSSELQIEGVRTDRLVKLCNHFRASTYISPFGAADYLKADGFTTKTATSLVFQDFNPPPYPQANSKEFISHLSIVDVVANLGWEKTRDYVTGTYKI